MPPKRFSRHTFTTQITRPNNLTYLTDREKYKYETFPDNISHIVREGDTLQGLAARYWAAISDPPEFSAAELWWIIADYQPKPIHDPTIKLISGQAIVIPSLRTVQDKIFNPGERSRRGI